MVAIRRRRGAMKRRTGLRGGISVPGCGVVRVGGVRWVRPAMPCGGVRFRARCAAARFRHGAGSWRLPARHEGGAWMVGDRHFRYNAPRAEILLCRAGLCAVRACRIVETDTWRGGCRSAGAEACGWACGVEGRAHARQRRRERCRPRRWSQRVAWRRWTSCRAASRRRRLSAAGMTL